jgi:dUTP pyrophosphatase
MKIKIKRFDKNLPLPKRASDGAAAFDLAAREKTEVPAGEVRLVPLNVAVETPPGHFLLLAARSSTHKKGLLLANGIGIGDPDFSGDEDEYHAALLNFTSKPVVVEKGDRVAQGMFVKFETPEWEEVSKMNRKTRGGFGSTGPR